MFTPVGGKQCFFPLFLPKRIIFRTAKVVIFRRLANIQEFILPVLKRLSLQLIKSRFYTNLHKFGIKLSGLHLVLLKQLRHLIYSENTPV